VSPGYLGYVAGLFFPAPVGVPLSCLPPPSIVPSSSSPARSVWHLLCVASLSPTMGEKEGSFSVRGMSQGEIQIATNIYWNTFYELLLIIESSCYY